MSTREEVAKVLERFETVKEYRSKMTPEPVRNDPLAAGQHPLSGLAAAMSVGPTSVVSSYTKSNVRWAAASGITKKTLTFTLFNGAKQIHTEEVAVSATDDTWGAGESVVLKKKGPFTATELRVSSSELPFYCGITLDKRNRKIPKGATLTVDAGPGGFLSLSDET